MMSQRFEVLVVGSGPAGIAAAVSAAEQGIRVGLIDENPNAGGQIWRSSLGKNGPDASHDSNAARWCDRLSAARIIRLQGWSVFDLPSRNILRAERCGKVADFEFVKLILATGARERFLPFPGWTLPNVMGVGAIQAMIKGGLPVHGKRIVIAGSGPLLLAVAASLKAAGANVLCICEQATLSRLVQFACSPVVFPSKVGEGIRYRLQTLGTPFHTSAWPVEAIGEDKVTAPPSCSSRLTAH